MKFVNIVRGFVLAMVAIAATGVADARPFAIDVHGSICQAAANQGSVTYDFTGITALSNNVTVVCPLSAIAMQSDTFPQVKVQLKMYSKGSVSCTFQATTLGGSSSTFNFAPTSDIFSTVQVSPVDEPVYPHDGTVMPTEVSINCTLAQGSIIGSIQIETLPVTPPGAPAAPAFTSLSPGGD